MRILLSRLLLDVDGVVENESVASEVREEITIFGNSLSITVEQTKYRSDWLLLVVSSLLVVVFSPSFS